MASDAWPVSPQKPDSTQTTLGLILLRFQKRRQTPATDEESRIKHDRWCLKKITAVRARHQHAQKTLSSMRHRPQLFPLCVSEYLFLATKGLLRRLFRPCWRSPPRPQQPDIPLAARLSSPYFFLCFFLTLFFFFLLSLELVFLLVFLIF